MKNKIKLVINLIIIYLFLTTFIKSEEQFIFNITEFEILENGKIFKGSKRGFVESNSGITIEADEFLYDKDNEILKASGHVKIVDELNDLILKSELINYDKNLELITAKKDVELIVGLKFKFYTKELQYFKNKSELLSKYKSTIYDDMSNTYELDKFNYSLNDKIVKGINIVAKNQDETINLKDGIINLDSKEFIASDTKIFLKKDVFNNADNDPRIYASSSKKIDDQIIFNNAIFTSCKKYKDNCPPWSLQSKKITHNKVKKQIIYDESILKVYGKPVLYFPKFFHPDPSVKRQSGILKPILNNSNILGSSINVPYFHVISDYQDITFNPTVFDDKKLILQNEYRQKWEKSSLIADFSLVKDYLSKDNKKKNITHLFANFESDLDLNTFNKSKLSLNIEKVNNDSYLKVFEGNLSTTNLKPDDINVLQNEIKLNLEHNKFDLEIGFNSFENLQLINSDRYQYVMPYYYYSGYKVLENFDGVLNFLSNGTNKLINTNNLQTKVINDINFNSLESISKYGAQNNYGIYFKNINSLGKKDPIYKDTAQSLLTSLIEYNLQLPLIKQTQDAKKTITPKASIRVSPNDMKDFSSLERQIDINNFFDINRLGLEDTFESGKSLTLGLDYLSKNNQNDNKFNFQLGTVIRDKENNDLPLSSSLNQKNSDLFGKIKFDLNESLNFNYDFGIDNDYSTFKYNSIDTTYSNNNFVTKFRFIEKDNFTEKINSIENITTYNLDSNNSFKFSTRRNREINLTEYYDFVYQYQNDCLTAGIQYRKSFYNDRDFQPSEDILFTISLIPLTSFEQKVN